MGAGKRGAIKSQERGVEPLASDCCQETFFFCPIIEQQEQDKYNQVDRHMFTRGEKFQSQRKMKGRSFGISTRNSPQIRWTFRRYRNAFVFLRVFVHSLMSINYSAFQNIFAFLDEIIIFSYTSHITCCD